MRQSRIVSSWIDGMVKLKATSGIVSEGPRCPRTTVDHITVLTQHYILQKIWVVKMSWIGVVMQREERSHSKRIRREVHENSVIVPR